MDQFSPAHSPEWRLRNPRNLRRCCPGGGATLHLGLPLFGIGATILAKNLGGPVAVRRARFRRHVEEVALAGTRRVVSVLPVRPEGEEPIPEATILGRHGHGKIVAGCRDDGQKPRPMSIESGPAPAGRSGFRLRRPPFRSNPRTAEGHDLRVRSWEGRAGDGRRDSRGR